jgi:hypothetical protein
MGEEALADLLGEEGGDGRLVLEKGQQKKLVEEKWIYYLCILVVRHIPEALYLLHAAILWYVVELKG